MPIVLRWERSFSVCILFPPSLSALLTSHSFSCKVCFTVKFVLLPLRLLICLYLTIAIPFGFFPSTTCTAVPACGEVLLSTRMCDVGCQ